ncbi:MAG: SPASM domain-containing protein [Candidatus Omnitrophica bacterium]|nr:SPASM domain-containing protein [Candidatus Omnitrophota bacterium]
MEFVDLARYVKVNNPVIPKFLDLKKIAPVLMTQHLSLVTDPNNLKYAEELARKEFAVVPIRRQPPTSSYLNRESFPRRILFEMTSRCNYLCRMCPQHGLKRPRMDMDGKLYRKVIDEIDSHGIEGIWLYHLGESLLHPEFSDNLKHISTKNNLGIIWMSTNGQYFTEEKIRLVFGSNLHYINFSVHAVTEKAYKTVVPQGDFNAVQNNLNKFYEIKGSAGLPKRPYLHCQMIEQETTCHEVDDFIRMHYKKAEIVSVNMLEYVTLPNNSFGLKQRIRKPLTSCLRVTRNDCFIFSNGDVTLCDAAYNAEIKLGNIKERTLYEIWNGKERKNILKLNKIGKIGEIDFCRSCTDYDI